MTVGGVRALAPTATPLSCFFPPQLLRVSEVFGFFLRALVSGVSLSFVSAPLKSFVSVGRKLFHKGERRRGEDGLASIQLLTRTSCCCSCWAEVEGRSQSPAHESTQANAEEGAAMGSVDFSRDVGLADNSKSMSAAE